MVKSLEIVSYLRSIGIEPKCSASSLLPESRYGINYPINYQNTQVYYYNFYHSDFYPYTKQWWMIDLHTFVRLKSYQILSQRECNWVNKWTFDISLDNINWKTVHSYNNFTHDDVFQLPTTEVAQYIRIKGINEGCQNVGVLVFSRLFLYGYPMHIQTCQMKAQISLKRFLPLIVFFLS